MKLRTIFRLFLILSLLPACTKDHTLPIPDPGPNPMISETHPLKKQSLPLLEGVYQVVSGPGHFGDQVIIKANRTHILIAGSKGIYMVMQAGSLDSVVFLQGYWRDGYSDGTGLVSMTIGRDQGGTMLVTGEGYQPIFIRGAFGEASNLPDKSLELKYLAPFSEKVKNGRFYILAHRGGGRTSDLLPVSENSLAMIGFTERLGSDGIEIDVRLTKDNVPFLYHDNDLNIRLTKKGPLAGPAENYTWEQLQKYVTLIHGEKIPTLEEALTYVIDSTRLGFVYLDMKTPVGSLQYVIPVQQRMLERAEQKGRDVMIVVGIPTTDALEDLKSYPDFRNVPSLCELSVEDVRDVNARVWAPRWTLGMQTEAVEQMHAEGRLAVCWTIDQPGWIKTYIEEGQFDGLLTNFPYVVAYYHYTQK